MHRYALALFALLLVAAATAFPQAVPDRSRGQVTPPSTGAGYEYDVLAGVQQAGSNNQWVGPSGKTLSCGWHSGSGCGRGGSPRALDMLAGAETPVYVAIRTVVAPPPAQRPLAYVHKIVNEAYAITVDSSDKVRCRKTYLRIEEPDNGEHDYLAYFHIVESTAIRDAFAASRPLDIFPATAGATKLTPLGEVAYVRSNVWSAAGAAALLFAREKDIRDLTTRYFEDDGGTVYLVGEHYGFQQKELGTDGNPTGEWAGADEAVDTEARRLEVPTEPEVIAVKVADGRTVSYYVRKVHLGWRQKAVEPDADFPACTTTGSHLHQDGDNSLAYPVNKVFTNRKKDPDAAGDSGFPVGSIRPYRPFCTDVWLFKIKTAPGDPLFVSPAATCDAQRYRIAIESPSNGSITASPGGLSHRPGALVTLTATASNPSTHRFASWGGDCAGTPAIDSCVLIMHGHKRVTGTFEAGSQPPPPTTTPTEPAAPTNLTATEGDGSIRIEWTDPSDSSINGYEYCTTTTSGADCTSWHPISGATATTTMHTISGLMNGTTYYVQIRARNSVGPSDASNEDSATPRATTTPPPTSTVPAAPTGLGATAGDGSIDLAWVDPGDSSITSYEYCTNTTAGADCTSWRTISGATATTIRHTISLLANGARLMNGTTYYVKIRARNSEGASGASNEASATPRATTPPPQPIASLTINAATIAGDGTVNKAEKDTGFAIGGSSEAGASVTVTVGTMALSAVTAGSTGSWTVSVPAAASYVSDGQLTISATATRSGYSDGSASATVTVDTVPPSVSYNNVPTSLTVNTEVTISPTTTDDDIHRYALKTGSTLPSDLSLDDMSGVISGSPDAATTAAVNLTIVVTDNARNSLDVPLRLPAVTAATTPPPTTYALAATAGVGGSVSCATASGPASCSGTFEEGTGVTVTADPNDGYQVDSWSGDCSGSGSGPTCNVAMNAPRPATWP